MYLCTYEGILWTFNALKKHLVKFQIWQSLLPTTRIPQYETMGYCANWLHSVHTHTHSLLCVLSVIVLVRGRGHWGQGQLIGPRQRHKPIKRQPVGEEVKPAQPWWGGNAICETMDISFTAFLSHFNTICHEPVNMHVIRLRWGGVWSRGGEGRASGETDHFSVNLQQFPPSKNVRGEKGKKSAEYFPFSSQISFSLIQLDLSIPYLWHTGSIHHIALWEVGGERDEDDDSLRLSGGKGDKSR